MPSTNSVAAASRIDCGATSTYPPPASAYPPPVVERANSITDLVARLGICRTKAYSEINAGRIRARKIGARTVVLESDLVAYLNALPAVATKIGEAA